MESAMPAVSWQGVRSGGRDAAGRGWSSTSTAPPSNTPQRAAMASLMAVAAATTVSRLRTGRALVPWGIRVGSAVRCWWTSAEA